MTVPASSIKIADIRNELGLSGGMSLATAAAQTLNDCATGGSTSAPHTVSEWAGYNHSAVPATPSPSTNPGDDSSPSEDPQQDSHIYVSWSPITCASDYDVQVSSTSSTGPWSDLATDINDDFYAHNVGSADTQRWYRVRATSNLGDDGSYSSGVEGRTSPTVPQSPSATWTDETCSDPEARISWTNGTSPGARQSKAETSWRKNATGSWSAWSTTECITAI